MGESFIEYLGRAIERGKVGAEEMARKRAELKWTPEHLRALAYTRMYSVDADVVVVEALACAADEIERLNEEAKWAHIRSAMSKKRGGMAI